MAKEMVTRVIIFASGGCIQSIVADRSVDIWLVDWDEIECGEDASDLYRVDVDPAMINQQFGKVGRRDGSGAVITFD